MYSLAEIADITGADLIGDPRSVISGLATIQTASQGQITFLDNPAYCKYLPKTQASAVILSKDFFKKCPTNALITQNPYYAYAKLTALFKINLKAAVGIHSSAKIAEDAKIESDVAIGPNVVVASKVSIGAGVVIEANTYIGEHTSIGVGTHLLPNITVYHHCQVGKHCKIHSGAVIGSDGFGLAKEKGKWYPIEQLGRVVIGDDVLIGACTSIDRGALSDTVICRGVKIDNQVQIGHNVIVDEHTVIAGCSAIAGSTRVGKHCIIGGDVSISGHLEIADDVTITGGSRVPSHIRKSGIYSSGMPLQSNRAWHKTFVRLSRLDQLAKTVRRMEKILLK